MHFRAALTSLALVPSSIATAAAGAALQPIGNWDLDYGDTRCTAGRSFGTASSPVVFGIIPSISGNTYQLLVSVQRTGPTFARESLGTVDFGRGGIRSWLLYYGGKGVKLAVYQFRVSAAEIEQARSATTVSLRSAEGDHYTFALSDTPALLDGLKKCTADLQQYWNMDGKQTVAIAVPPKGDLRSVFTSDDYPTEALRRQQQGTAQYQLLVDENGAVAGCDVLRPSGVAALDSMGCEVIKGKAKFRPAMDSHGKPVRSVVTTPPISWRVAF